MTNILQNTTFTANEALIKFTSVACKNPNFTVPGKYFNDPMYLDALSLIQSMNGHTAFEYWYKSFSSALKKELKKNEPYLQYVTKTLKPSTSKLNRKYALVQLGLNIQRPDIILNASTEDSLPSYVLVGLIANYMNKFNHLDGIEELVMMTDEKHPGMIDDFITTDRNKYTENFYKILYTTDVTIKNKNTFLGYVEENEIDHLSLKEKLQFISNLYICLKLDALQTHYFESEHFKHNYILKHLRKICFEFPEWKTIQHTILPLHDDLKVLTDKEYLYHILDPKVFDVDNSIEFIMEI